MRSCNADCMYHPDESDAHRCNAIFHTFHGSNGCLYGSLTAVSICDSVSNQAQEVPNTVQANRGH